MFSPSEVLELVMLCRQTAHSATDFSPMDGNAKLKKEGSQHKAGEKKSVGTQAYVWACQNVIIPA